MGTMLDTLKGHAREAHAAHPQYDGYFDTWTLGRLTKRIRTKGGVDLDRGTIVLTDFDGQHAIPGLEGDIDVVTIYDPATTHNVAVEVTRIERLATVRSGWFEWIVTEMDHRQHGTVVCTACMVEAKGAAIMASVTGSIGASQQTRADHDANLNHGATVVRGNRLSRDEVYGKAAV